MLMVCAAEKTKKIEQTSKNEKAVKTEKPEEQYLQWLKEGTSKEKQMAAKELGKLKDPAALPALREALKDQEKKVREAVIQALIEIPGKESVAALSIAFDDPDTSNRETAIKGLVKKYIPEPKSGIKQILNTIMDYFTLSEETKMIEPWIKIEPEAAIALTKRLSEGKPILIVAIDAIHSLRVYSAIPDLIKAMRGDEDTIVAILKTFADFKVQSVGENITPLLLSKNDNVVGYASYCLGKINYAPAIPSLINLYNYSADIKYQKYALIGLSLLAAKDATKLFHANLTSSDPEFRVIAAEAFGRLGDTVFTEEVARAFLNEQNIKVKLAMDFALFKLGRKEHMMDLIKALDAEYDLIKPYIIECGADGFAEISRYLPNLPTSTKIKLIKIMGYSYNPAAIKYLEPYLNDVDIDIATSSFEAIKRLKKIEEIK